MSEGSHEGLGCTSMVRQSDVALALGLVVVVVVVVVLIVVVVVVASECVLGSVCPLSDSPFGISIQG